MTHTTRWGNEYTDQEWAAEQAMYQADEEQAKRYIEKMEIMYRIATEKLEALGITSNAREVISHIWENGTEDITFTSPERKAAVEEIASWMEVQERQIHQEAIA